ncbi:MAG: beta-glucoside-specific PTS transporter subunit IIABC [Turicibacter sp.]|nr:beta-glucoside-specific PTS transporter subunit IIABC [Turicibacter sp.]
MRKYEQLAKNILEGVGGKENVVGLTHCITRLRFKLKDESAAQTQEIKNMDGVVTVMQAGGQYQVVIGNHVPDVFELVNEFIGSISAEAGSEKKLKPFDALLDNISGIFQPFLAIMTAGGMIRGLTALLVFLGAFDRQSGAFRMLDNIGDSVFMFLPVFIGLTTARKFKVNEFVGMLLGAGLMNPNLSLNTLRGLMDAPETILFPGTILESPVFQTVFGIPWMARNYASSVIPIIFIVILASYVQKLFKKVIPAVVANFIVPFLTVLVTLPIGFLVVGPIFTIATDLLMAFFEAIVAFSPILFGVVAGFFWQILVMFGLHWAIIPMGILQFTENGWQQITGPLMLVAFGQTAALLALYFKMKDPKEKSLALPAIASGIVGITEPAIYGFTLKRKAVFIYTCIAGAVGSGFVMARDVKMWNQGGLGVFTLPNFIRPDGSLDDLNTKLIGSAIAIVVAFTLTWFFHKEPEMEVTTNEGPKAAPSKEKKSLIEAPIKGEVLALSSIKDEAFASGLLGKGVAINPSEGKVVAPANGVLTTLFPTKHAVGITTDEGVELLIHVGMDTVQLDGEHFKALVKQGDRVQKGQTLVEFDMEAIKAKGYSLVTPVIVTNTNTFSDVVETKMNKAILSIVR